MFYPSTASPKRQPVRWRSESTCATLLPMATSAGGEGRRTYGDACAAAHALDLVGERWALLVVRELLLGPKRFTDLRAGLRNAKPSVLSQRLRELEAAGVVQRRTLAPPSGARVYELTDDGKDLEPIVEIGRAHV